MDLPSYQSPDSSGVDLYAAINHPMTIQPREILKVPTGIHLEIPVGYEAQIRPRSGLAYKHGITMINSPGTIDADYRGEICVLMINLGNKSFQFSRGDRIAQMIFTPVVQAEWVIAEDLNSSFRGAGGFGSTGV